MAMGSLGKNSILRLNHGGRPEVNPYRVPYWPDREYFAAVDPQRLQQFCQNMGYAA